jgi:hypothetical protein
VSRIGPAHAGPRPHTWAARLDLAGSSACDDELTSDAGQRFLYGSWASFEERVARASEPTPLFGLINPVARR